MPDISVVVPVYNSEKILQAFYENLVETICLTGKTFEIIFVDDCSKDNSVGKIVELKEQFPDIILVRLKKNYGQYTATWLGMSHAKCNQIVTIDIDPTLPIHLFSLFRASSGTAELIYAEAITSDRNMFRSSGSLFFNWAVKRMVNPIVRSKISDKSGSSLRVITRELAQRCFLKLCSPALLDVCLMNLACGIQFIQIENGISDDKSSYSYFKLIHAGLSLIIAKVAGIIQPQPAKPRDYNYEIF